MNNFDKAVFSGAGHLHEPAPGFYREAEEPTLAEFYIDDVQDFTNLPVGNGLPVTEEDVREVFQCIYTDFISSEEFSGELVRAFRLFEVALGFHPTTTILFSCALFAPVSDDVRLMLSALRRKDPANSSKCAAMLVAHEYCQFEGDFVPKCVSDNALRMITDRINKAFSIMTFAQFRETIKEISTRIGKDESLGYVKGKFTRDLEPLLASRNASMDHCAGLKLIFKDVRDITQQAALILLIDSFLSEGLKPATAYLDQDFKRALGELTAGGWAISIQLYCYLKVDTENC